MNGWWKFHRQMFENPVVNKDSEYFYVWCWILTYATYEEKRVLFNGKDIVLEKGQLLTTTKHIATSLNINESKVNRILKKLKIEKQIDKQTSSRNTLITVLNWNLYQESDKQNEEQVTNKRQASEEQMKSNRQTNGKPSYYNKERIEEHEKEENGDIIVTEHETVSRSDIQSVLNAWNELEQYGVRAVTKLRSGTDRHDRLCARIKEYGIDDVLTAIKNIKQSDFLQGKNNKGWAITFDWFVRPNNFPKVLDGNYPNKGDDNNGCIRRNDTKNVKDPYAEELERLLNEQ